MQQSTATLVVAGLGIGGTLGGIVVGHFLTRSWQQKQWMLDQRKDEFRQLLSALTLAFSFHLQGISTAESDARVLAVIRDRLYIAVEVEDLKVLERWKEIIAVRRSPMLLSLIDAPFCDLTTDIVVAALKMPHSRLSRLFKRKQ